MAWHGMAASRGCDERERRSGSGTGGHTWRWVRSRRLSGDDRRKALLCRWSVQSRAGAFAGEDEANEMDAARAVESLEEIRPVSSGPWGLAAAAAEDKRARRVGDSRLSTVRILYAIYNATGRDLAVGGRIRPFFHAVDATESCKGRKEGCGRAGCDADRTLIKAEPEPRNSLCRAVLRRRLFPTKEQKPACLKGAEKRHRLCHSALFTACKRRYCIRQGVT